METQTVTVVFTDVVDAIAYSATEDPSAADELRHAHLGALRHVIRSNGGTEAKTLGDGVMAIFANPSSALDAAVAMQVNAARETTTSPLRIALKIGISAGESSFADGDYFGDPIVEATQLCAIAQGGQILLAAVVRVMAGRRSRHAFSSVGELELEGLIDPVPTLQVDWEKDVPLTQSMALPARLVLDRDAAFVGRQQELEQFAQSLEAARTGSRQIVLVGGEPGIGKTTLTSLVCGQAHELGAVVLYGRCDDDLGVPYQAFIEAMSHYVAQAPIQELNEYVVEYGGELCRLVPGLARRVSDCPAPSATDPDAERYLTFGAAAGLLTFAARHELIVIAIDDLHWADKPTLQLFRYLIAALEGSQVVLIGTYRNSEVSKVDLLGSTLSALRREEGVTRIDLEGLSSAEVKALVVAAAGQDLDADSSELVAPLRRETGGNPFFVREILRHLAESGFVAYDEDGHWIFDTDLSKSGIPQSLREVVGYRVGRIGADAEDVLSAAAVIGRDFDLDLLGRVAERSEDELLDVMEQVQLAALISETAHGLDRYTFSHALIQHTLYESLAPPRRRRTHRRVAEALEQRHGDADDHIAELAHHWLRAAEPDKALRCSQMAAQLAMRSLAPDEAIRWFQESLALQLAHRADDQTLRCELLIELGNAQKLAGEPAHRETLLDACWLAESLNDPDRMVRASLSNYRGFWTAVGRTDEDKVRALEATLAKLPEGDTAIRAQLMGIYCNEMTFSATVERRRELADIARDMAKRCGNPAILAHVLNTIYQPLWALEFLDERLENTELAYAVAEELGDPVTLFSAVAYRMRSCTEAGMLEEADKMMERLHDLAEELWHPYPKWIVSFSRGTWALLLGDPDEAERFANEALALGTSSGQPDALTLYFASIHCIRWQQGRLAELLPFIEQAVADNPGLPGYQSAVARGLLDADREEDALAILQTAVDCGFSHIPIDLTRSTALTIYGEVAARLGHVDGANKIVELLSPWSDRLAYIATAIDGPIAHTLGTLCTMLGRYDDAEQHFEQAERINATVNAKFFSARGKAEWGRMLLLRAAPGDAERAEVHLSAAAVSAERGGYSGVTRRIASITQEFSLTQR